jgi:signal transduction histidine kinase
VSIESPRGSDPQDRQLQVCFHDTGTGIPPENLPLVFEPWYSTKARDGQGGSGLGLTLCAAIVRAHSGSISADSPPGGGARIRIQLPLALADLTGGK